MAVLYWDKLASILPMDYMYEPEKLGPHMQALLAEGLVEPVIPGQYLHQIPDFDKTFIDRVEARERRMRSPRSRLIETVSIHAEKLGQIPDFLVSAGLARMVDYGWYEVELHVGYQFMAYLAVCLGAIPEVNAVAVTDRSRYFVPPRVQRPTNQHVETIHTEKARRAILQALLPMPAGPLDLGAILKFKARYGHLLPALRTKIEVHSRHLGSLTSAEERLDATELFIRESKLQIDEIAAAMQPSFNKVVYGALMPLFAAGIAWQATNVENGTAFTAGGLAFGGAAYQALSSMKGNSSVSRGQPLAYLARAKIHLSK